MKGSLTTLTRHAIGKDRWDAFVHAADEAWLWHRFDMQDALATWPSRHDLSFAVIDDAGSGQELLGVVPVHLIEGRVARLFSINVLHSMGGPACRERLGNDVKRAVLEQVRTQLITLARQHAVQEIHVALSPMAPAFRADRCPPTNPLIDVGLIDTSGQTWVVDLRQSAEEIRRAYSQLTKRELKKMRQGDYEIREACGAADLGTYYKLHCETYHRTGVIPHPIEYFRHIFEVFLQQGLSRVVFLILDGSVVAAQNTGLYKQSGIYWTGASTSKKRGGENRILFDDQMMFARAHAYEWYETGEAFPHVNEGKLKGLSDFKRSLGGRLHPYYRGTIDTRTPIRRALRLVRSLR